MTIRTITPGARKNYIARIESATATGDYTRLVRNIRWAAEAGLATGHMATAYHEGGDPQRTLTLLATWLGHTSTAHTYWYLTATPHLMALAAQRLNQPQEQEHS